MEHENGQRPIGFVARRIRDVVAPEVVREYLVQAGRRVRDIVILHDRNSIIENVVTAESVKVANRAKCQQGCVFKQTLQSHGLSFDGDDLRS